MSLGNHLVWSKISETALVFRADLDGASATVTVAAEDTSTWRWQINHGETGRAASLSDAIDAAEAALVMRMTANKSER